METGYTKTLINGVCVMESRHITNENAENCLKKLQEAREKRGDEYVKEELKRIMEK